MGDEKDLKNNEEVVEETQAQDPTADLEQNQNDTDNAEEATNDQDSTQEAAEGSAEDASSDTEEAKNPFGVITNDTSDETQFKDEAEEDNSVETVVVGKGVK